VRVRHRELRDLTGLRVQLPDVRGAVAGVPDRALRVDDQVVRVHALVDLVALELTRLVVQVGDVVAGLAHAPDAAVRGDVRIARPAPLPGDLPLLHLDRLALGGHAAGHAGPEHGGEYQRGGCPHDPPPYVEVKRAVRRRAAHRRAFCRRAASRGWRA